MSARTLTGSEITADILKRLTYLERLVICPHCGGEGSKPHKTLGKITCWPCEGTGNRISALEKQT